VEHDHLHLPARRLGHRIVSSYCTKPANLVLESLPGKIVCQDKWNDCRACKALKNFAGAASHSNDLPPSRNRSICSLPCLEATLPVFELAVNIVRSILRSSLLIVDQHAELDQEAVEDADKRRSGLFGWQ
jgi:hypothetical protein